jgi:BirA family biotin operon repressor/biotin-[acetyl-CoA-carboxylase] ligase
LPLKNQVLKDAPVIELESIDSTNNYAMRLIDADTAQEGLTIVASEQTGGKGQRGRQWVSPPGQNLLMSMIVVPDISLDHQFIFNAATAVAIADTLQSLYEHWNVAVKWPNDILINDKKAGGILIENVLRGNTWSYSIIGLGLNVLQAEFPPELPHAVSLYQISGVRYPLIPLMHEIRNKILDTLYFQLNPIAILKSYNDFLYRRNVRQRFTDHKREWEATVLEVKSDGSLLVLTEQGIAAYQHGHVHWVW